MQEDEGCILKHKASFGQLISYTGPMYGMRCYLPTLCHELVDGLRRARRW